MQVLNKTPLKLQFNECHRHSGCMRSRAIASKWVCETESRYVLAVTLRWQKRMRWFFSTSTTSAFTFLQSSDFGVPPKEGQCLCWHTEECHIGEEGGSNSNSSGQFTGMFRAVFSWCITASVMKEVFWQRRRGHLLKLYLFILWICQPSSKW